MKMPGLLVIALLLIVGSLSGGIAFDQPVSVFEAEHYGISREIKPLPGGNMLVMFTKHIEGSVVSHIQVFSADFLPVWQTAVQVPNFLDAIVHPDGKITVFRKYSAINDVLVVTFSPTGEMIENLSGLRLSCSILSKARFAADGTGGFHFLASFSNFARYQYVNDQCVVVGNGIDLVQGSYQLTDTFHPTSDGGVLIALIRNGGFTVFKIGANHQMSWSRAIDHSGSIISLRLAKRSDGSSYVAWDDYRHHYVNLLSSTGQKLWTEDYTPGGVPYSKIEGLGVDNAGNLILHYLGGINQYLDTGSHCLEVISSTAVVVSSYIPDSDTDPVPPMKMQIFPVSTGGWYVLATKDQEDVSPAHYIQCYDGSHQPWQDPVVFGNSNSISVYVVLFGDDLLVSYLLESVEETGILVQRLDTSGNLLYPGNGLPVLSGSNGKASSVKALSLSNGSVIVAWIESHPAGIRSSKYQIVSTSGIPCLQTPQTIWSQDAENVTLFETNTTNVLVVWDALPGSGGRSYAQLISPSGDILWEPGGRLLLQDNSDHYYSYWNNSLYVATESSDGLRVHRFDSGYQIWGPEGVLVAALNPNYNQWRFQVTVFTGNQVCWYQGDGDTIDMAFTNFFFEDGSVLYPPDNAVQAYTSLPDPYVGAYISGVFNFGNEMYYKMLYEYWEWAVYGHSDPGQWILKFSTFVQKVNPDGSPMGSAIAVNNLYAIDNGKCYLEGTSEYRIRIKPLNGGTEQEVLTPWPVNEIIGLQDQNVLVNGITASNNWHYAMINGEGSLEYWDDSVITTMNIIRTCVSGQRVWYVVSSKASYEFTTGLYVQKVNLSSTGSDDPVMTPAVPISLTNYPNPFRDQTQVCVKLEDAAPLTLKIYNIRGQLVRTIRQEEAIRGDNYFIWDGRDSNNHSCATGVYYLKAETASSNATLRTLRIK